MTSLILLLSFTYCFKFTSHPISLWFWDLVDSQHGRLRLAIRISEVMEEAVRSVSVGPSKPSNSPFTCTHHHLQVESPSDHAFEIATDMWVQTPSAIITWMVDFLKPRIHGPTPVTRTWYTNAVTWNWSSLFPISQVPLCWGIWVEKFQCILALFNSIPVSGSKEHSDFGHTALIVWTSF